jgi:thioredoxin-like negative regulator of GroEL
MTLPRPDLSRLAALCSVCLLLGLGGFAAPASAEEIRWRNDYHKARKEATEKGKPLVIDFGTENCYWCKQLDARTFRDPAIIALMNEHCIPLKIDANANQSLTDALRVQSFPTLVFASSDGRILGFQEGFCEVPKMKELLQKSIGNVSTPEWMTRDYKEASRAIANADYARAVSLLKSILEDGKDRPVQGKARGLLAELEQQAAARVARAKHMADMGQTTEAVETINELVKSYAGTPAAREGSQMLMTLAARSTQKEQSARVKKAREMLAQAREEYRQQQFAICLDRCEALAASYTDLPEALHATQLASEIKSNPEWLKLACDQLGDRLSILYLSMAETWLRKGQPQMAIHYFERVVQHFPNTRQAEEAQVRLAQIQGLPSRQVDLKK